MKPLNDLSVEDSGDMCAKLNQIDVTIPPRTQGRTSQHREARVARDFLEVISDTDLLNYPLHIRHQDRPDFLLSSQGRTTGIEITVCEHPDASRADAYSENKGLSGIQGVPSYRIGEQRSRKEIRAIATGNANIYPAMGREWEDNWIDAIVDSVKKKDGKFRSEEFGKHDRNWLLVYDNWSPYPTDLDDRDFEHLVNRLHGSSCQNTFDKVFILKRNSYGLLEFSPKSMKYVEYPI